MAKETAKDFVKRAAEKVVPESVKPDTPHPTTERPTEQVVVEFEHHAIDAWDYEVDGKTYHVEKGGSKVPADKADKIIAASRKTGAHLRRA